ncbi:Multimodular transpeptidase-transglycosylase [Brevibacillus laterosporus]|uniref:PBP1A family penicillin-binding protein n=1 Tax=Brevibacillus laterosporus TaxID=1465 RepID=A0A518V2F5_BRELA|nr:PBP1A family penicillin-binding protein [Brevibacillus laterosporus]QDX91165.1 PBP1A family penicillin-binding protein [Brevibacillus laterosporus]RAP28100.1 Multimodular transpeptidase-transglycosylase [Brevibacillus laterosporus]
MAQAKKKKKKKLVNKWILLIIGFAVFLILSVIGGYFALLYAGGKMVDMDENKLKDIKLEATKIIDVNGKELSKLYVLEDREYVTIDKVPKKLVDAFVAVEDKRFFEHNGVDMIRIGGAIWKDIRAGSTVEGASTITQQLAKNVFLSHEKTFWRKTKEVSIAINLENRFTKDQIMEMYLNKIYLGHGAYGVKAAANYYFGKEKAEHLDTLTTAEIAQLAAIPKGPTIYSPFKNPEKSKERRDTIIRLMAEQGIITVQEKETAQQQSLPDPSREKAIGGNKAYQAFLDYVVDEAEERYGIAEDELYSGGYLIYTTLNTDVQDAMVKNFANAKNFPKDGTTNKVDSGMVVLDAKTGGIAGIVGGRNYVHKGWNNALSLHQPGSSFKPLAVYAPALDTGKWHAGSMLSNKRQSFNGYEPRNWNNQYSDSIRMDKAVQMSLNIPTVWLLNEIGIDKSLKYIKDFGITLDPTDRNLSIALGGLHKGTSPLRMAQAYTAFTNGGKVKEAHAIDKIKDIRTGREETRPVKETQAISPNAAWEMHELLRNAVQSGTGTSAKMKNWPVAGKTGTTQSALSSSANKDAWFVGYNPRYIGSIWMGFPKEDKGHIMYDGSSKTAHMFSVIMQEALKNEKPTEFVRPDGVADHQKVEETQEEATTPPSLSVRLTIEGSQPVALLMWEDTNEKTTGYDVMRYLNSPESAEKISSKQSGKTFVDPVKEGVLYKYFVVPYDENGNPGSSSNIGEVNTKQLEELLQNGENQNEDNNNSTENGQPPNNGSNGSNEHDGNGNGDNTGNDNSTPPGLPNGNNQDNGQGHGQGQGNDSSGNGFDPNANNQRPADIPDPNQTVDPNQQESGN